MYRCIAADSFPGVPDFPCSRIWKSIIPTKICFFMWAVFHKRIPTIDLLKRKGLELANRCVLCCKEEESDDHLFTEFDYAKKVWSFIKNRCREAYQPQDDILLAIRNWSDSLPNTIDGWFCFCLLHATCWHLWLERNRCIFQDKSLLSSTIARRIANAVIEWVVIQAKVDKSQGVDWLKNRFD
ncbi:unnamed protein product [Linum trigynum]|uniref:Reverse transcriptase zinc-binding domain-containing protein n=1 Tax=Linum trigynum TaxID=586398 RepID=A0AAV2GW86_9ROSI